MNQKSSRLLDRQKPIRGRRSNSPWFRWFMGACALVGFALVATIIIVNTMPQRSPATVTRVVKHEAPIAPYGWRVRVQPESIDRLSDATLRAVADTITRDLRTGSREELESVARKIQKAHLLDRVHLVRSGSRDVIAQLVPRKPIMRVEADRLRWLTADAKIYGEVPVPAESSIEKPLLKGIFDTTGRRRSMADDQTLRVEHDEADELREAIDLLDKTRDVKLSVKEIEFVPYRGFTLVLDGTETVVTVGRSPFDDTLRHLVSVLRTLEKRGSQAARIELDYSGKAFVKERKL